MKNKITEDDIINFFKEKPSFNREESAKFGWSPTQGGLYTITDIYCFFAEKEISKNNIDDIIYKSFKGKPFLLKSIGVKNHYYKDYYRNSFNYYYFDITTQEAFKLKKQYEKNSFDIVNKTNIEKKERISLSAIQSKKSKILKEKV